MAAVTPVLDNIVIAYLNQTYCLKKPHPVSLLLFSVRNLILIFIIRWTDFNILWRRISEGAHVGLTAFGTIIYVACAFTNFVTNLLGATWSGEGVASSLVQTLFSRKYSQNLLWEAKRSNDIVNALASVNVNYIFQCKKTILCNNFIKSLKY